MSSSADLQLGQALATRGFQVVRELGRGAAGRVLLARDLRAGREVALKVWLQSDLAGGIQRFVREAQVVGQLRHPGIVSVHDAFEVDRYACIVYELVPGGRTLQEAFALAPLEERLELVRQVAGALAHVHAEGLVHRDVKPGNVLIGPDGRARLTDFGAVGGASLERLTRTGAVVGTPLYMSPEQGVGKREAIGPRSDVWSLGVLLYEALTQTLPFQADSQLELLAMVAGTPATPPSSIVSALPSGAQEVCLRALAKDPADRYADAGAFEADLAAVIAGSYVSSGASALRPLALGAAAALLLLALALGLAFARAKNPAGASLAPSASASGPAPEITPRTAQGWRRLGIAHLAAERWEPAIAALTRALELDPGDALARRARVKALIYARHHERALEELEVCLRADPSDSELYFQNALLCFELGRGWPEGFEAERDVSTPLGHYFRGRVRGARGRAQEALEDFEAALAELPPDWRLYAGRAAARKRLGDLQGSLDDARSAAARTQVPEVHVTLANFLIDMSKVDEAEAVADGLLARLPDYPHALVLKGKVFKLRGELPAARAALERALKLDPGQQEARFALAMVCEAEGKFADALALYQSLAQAKGAQFGGLNNLGRLLLRLQRFAEAEPHLRRALEQQPSNPIVVLNLASVCLKLNRRGEALEYARRAADLTSQPDVLEQVASVLTKAGRADEALTVLERVLPPRPRTDYYRGVALATLGRSEAALEALGKALKGDERDASIWQARGLLLSKLGRFPESEADLSRALLLTPNPEVFGARGYARYRQDDLQGTLADWKRALELAPGLIAVRRNRIGALVKAERWADAIPDLEWILQRTPQDAGKRRLLATARLESGDAQGCLSECERYWASAAREPTGLALEGRARGVLGEHARALELFEAALALKPGYGPALMGQATELQALGRYREAIQILDVLIPQAGSRAPALRAQRAAAARKLAGE